MVSSDMRKQLRSSSIKKVKVRSPGNAVNVHFKIEKGSYAHCGDCGAKLNRIRVTTAGARTMAKSQKRSERPLPHLCSACMREQIKQRLY